MFLFLSDVIDELSFPDRLAKIFAMCFSMILWWEKIHRKLRNDRNYEVRVLETREIKVTPRSMFLTLFRLLCRVYSVFQKAYVKINDMEMYFVPRMTVQSWCERDVSIRALTQARPESSLESDDICDRHSEWTRRRKPLRCPLPIDAAQSHRIFYNVRLRAIAGVYIYAAANNVKCGLVCSIPRANFISRRGTQPAEK